MKIKTLFLIVLVSLTVSACKTASLSDQYGKLVIIENGQFKDMEAIERYTLIYDTPQQITTTNSPIVRLGIPTKEIKEITVERTARSSSQGGTIFSAIGDACVGVAKLAAGVF